VCQIPASIRAFTKILSDAIQNKNPFMKKLEVYKVLNELIIEKWLSVSFKNPEFFGMLPKPLNFSDRFKFIFFDAG
jgi:hypothetical protein